MEVRDRLADAISYRAEYLLLKWSTWFYYVSLNGPMDELGLIRFG